MGEGLRLSGMGKPVAVELIEDLGDGRAVIRQEHNGKRRTVSTSKLIGYKKTARRTSPILPPALPPGLMTGTQLERKLAEQKATRIDPDVEVPFSEPFRPGRGRAVPKPPKPARSRRFLDHVRALPCAVCGATTRSHPHHHGPRGMSEKTDDYRCIPLCEIDHHELHAGNRPELTDERIAQIQRDVLVGYCRQIEGT